MIIDINILYIIVSIGRMLAATVGIGRMSAATVAIDGADVSCHGCHWSDVVRIGRMSTATVAIGRNL